MAPARPSCAHFALRHIIDDENILVNTDVGSTILSSFYVDDVLKSVADLEHAKTIVEELQSSLSRRCFNLTEFTSNSCEFLNCIPADKLSKELKLNLIMTNLRVLNAAWVYIGIGRMTICVLT